MNSMSAPARATVQRIPQSAKSLLTQGRLKTDPGHLGLRNVRPTNSPALLEGNVDQRENPQKAVRETRVAGERVAAIPEHPKVQRDR